MPNEKNTVVMNESHDWLGDAAENYVRYVFAREGFFVFAGSKWGADLAMYHKDRPKEWWRIEVRSTDANKRPIKKSAKKLQEIADYVVEVRFNDSKADGTGHRLFIRMCRVNKDGTYSQEWHKITTQRNVETDQVHFSLPVFLRA